MSVACQAGRGNALAPGLLSEWARRRNPLPHGFVETSFTICNSRRWSATVGQVADGPPSLVSLFLHPRGLCLQLIF